MVWTVKEKGPHPIDAHVGSRVRLRRTLVGMSQEKLAAALGLTFQQVQKYERGMNRISSSRLFDLSKILDVTISYFFEGMPDAMRSEAVPMQPPADATPLPQYPKDPLTKRETLELVRAYYRIVNPDARRRLYELVRSIAGAEDAVDEPPRLAEGTHDAP